MYASYTTVDILGWGESTFETYSEPVTDDYGDQIDTNQISKSMLSFLQLVAKKLRHFNKNNLF
jgi:hypothetical protein